MQDYVFTLECDERPGITHAVTGALLTHSGDIKELKQFDDQYTERLFLRIDFSLQDESQGAIEALRADFEGIGTDFEASWKLWPEGEKRRVLIMVSKFEHCLNDLLFRAQVGELPIEIAAVVSNHPDHRELVEWHHIPFFRIPVTKETKPEAEAKLLELVDRFEIDLVVLARYMQVLSDDLARELTGKAINIHHSFLPSFKGAKPYHQAWERGVKTVGATAHFVDSELDEGPIIAQQLVEVDHSFGPKDLVAAGRDAECKALSNAVKWHCDGRVFLAGKRTVVLR
ncbi:formyltetrahydrofolate deformylase [Brevibacterium aurantiacum]|uniref:Formyltetrahydrofolate deformylase n=1 Tax=Brevibacterium aurantiacum TaxID=273384 RepID=A0A2A3Z899_BREAU|nr:formyltetrahydrofolate deformylase [Brevibacterium aurantiacum]AZL07899.1 formyltetrahydrofolate deformylase [Brevibacterium aurantiacum]MDN5608746.1 formyltetrahydrofolate deformylase [Brevibacterium sp.]MDN6379608.1 formyltetrahydrofolate deformylase [Brevibacterium aurantiacum]PCC48252.1 formyltetrahydrofolate deformylase [Brevibacterium aurantiacum]